MTPLNLYTFYDKNTKVWSGLPTKSVFNPDMGLGELILNVLNRTPTKITQISGDSGVEVTCGEMRIRAIRVAQNLMKLGYGKGDMICVAARNGEKLAPVVFGSFLIAAPVSTLDPTFNKDDLGHIMKTTRPKIIFCDPENLQAVAETCQELNLDSRIVVFEERVGDYMFIDDLLIKCGDEEYFVPPTLENVRNMLTVILCSSGTTGLSKGVCLSNAQLIMYLSSLWDGYDTDKLICFSSLYWLTGLVVLLMGTLSGMTRIITRETFTSDLWIDLVEKYKLTCYLSPPTQMEAICNNPRASTTDLSCIRVYVCGGSMVSVYLQNLMMQYMPNGRIMIGYGLSELSAIGVFGCKLQREGSVGYTFKGIKAKIVDEDGVALDNGMEGEVYIKSQYRFLGYYGNEEATKEILHPEGWLRTGDIGKFDEDGFLYILDRKKDIIKFNNYQIAPSELEELIKTIEGVECVCIVGIPTLSSDLPAALVVKSSKASLTAQYIKKYVSKRVGDYKNLRGGVYFVEELPMTPSGKVLRRKGREIAIKLYNNENLTQ